MEGLFSSYLQTRQGHEPPTGQIFKIPRCDFVNMLVHRLLETNRPGTYTYYVPIILLIGIWRLLYESRIRHSMNMNL